jgi:hypothetical protein
MNGQPGKYKLFCKHPESVVVLRLTMFDKVIDQVMMMNGRRQGHKKRQ